MDTGVHDVHENAISRHVQFRVVLPAVRAFSTSDRRSKIAIGFGTLRFARPPGKVTRVAINANADFRSRMGRVAARGDGPLREVRPVPVHLPGVHRDRRRGRRRARPDQPARGAARRAHRIHGAASGKSDEVPGLPAVRRGLSERRGARADRPGGAAGDGAGDAPAVARALCLPARAAEAQALRPGAPRRRVAAAAFAAAARERPPESAALSGGPWEDSAARPEDRAANVPAASLSAAVRIRREGALPYSPAASFTPSIRKWPRTLPRSWRASASSLCSRPGQVCCGAPLLSCGEVESARRVAGINRRVLAASGAETVLTPCAACGHTLKSVVSTAAR